MGPTLEDKTKPRLYKQIYDRLMASSKYGDPGEWSARKSQALVREYKERGGDWKKQKRSTTSLERWQQQNWRYSSRKYAELDGRYLPDAVWKRLTSRQKQITNRNKIECDDKEHCPYEDFVLDAFEEAGIKK